MNANCATDWVTHAQSLLCKAVADLPHAERHQAAIAFLDDFPRENVLDFVDDNQVAPHLYHALASHEESGALPPPLHDEVFSRLHTLHAATHRRISEYLSELDRIAEQLATSDIPMLALKNAGIARGLHQCPGCNPMGDLDVLVSPHDFRAAHQILVENDYQFAFRSPLEKAELDEAALGGGSEYWKTLPSGEKLWFELQWRPVAGRWIRPDQEPKAADLIARSVPIDGTAVRMLSPVDNLLQVALHTAKHTYVRAPGFRLHTDVDRIVRRQPIDWDKFVIAVQQIQVQTAVFFSLLIPFAIFRTPIPEAVLKQLAPHPLKTRRMHQWLRKASLFGPDDHKFSRMGYLLFNALLYDSVAGLGRAVFPNSQWMKERYQFNNLLLLPWFHGKRIKELLFRRSRT